MSDSSDDLELREVTEDDLAAFFEHQSDPEAAAMAVHEGRGREAFLAHWRRNVLGDPANDARTIVVGGRVAGYVSAWDDDGRRLVAYWLGREFWGRGIARIALDEFLRSHETRRPVHAYVALTNTRSIRVLEKCGFLPAAEPELGPGGVAEVLFVHDGAG